MIPLFALLAALPLEVELSAGPAISFAVSPTATATALRLRAAVDLLDTFSVGASMLGIPGSETGCGSNDPQSFKAVSGFVSARLHSSGGNQLFLEGGVGAGHLITLAGGGYCYENPQLRGGGGPAFLLEAGFRSFVTQNLALGISLAGTAWSNVGHAGHTGMPVIPEESGLVVTGFLLLVSVGWSFGR